MRLCSAEGISEAANLAELIAYSIMIAYNFRLGECPCSLMACHSASCKLGGWMDGRIDVYTTLGCVHIQARCRAAIWLAPACLH